MTLLLMATLFAQAQPEFRTAISLVHVEAEVRQNGKVIADLGKESFRVTDDGKPERIEHIGHEEEPLDVVLLFDTRYDMRSAVERVAAAAHAAMSDLRAGDRIAVMAFGGTAGNCKTDTISNLTSDWAAAERSIANQVLLREFRPNTNMCGIHRGLEGGARLLLGEGDRGRRRAIVAITDDLGAGTPSSTVRNTVRDLWMADAVVLGVIVNSGGFAIGIGPGYRGARYAARKTGGDTIQTVDAAEGLREMIHRLRSRYSLYYVTPPGKAGAERKIRVELSADARKRFPRATVRAKSGYVAPEMKH